MSTWHSLLVVIILFTLQLTCVDCWMKTTAPLRVSKRLPLSPALIAKPVIPHSRPSTAFSSSLPLYASSSSNQEDGKFDLSAWLSPSTRGGVIVWSGILILIPLTCYQILTSQGMDGDKVGAYVGAIFVLLSNLLWASTYIFRVANKDMTYAKQLREYEDAVLKKRLEELGDDEVNALMEEIEKEEGSAPTTKSAAAPSTTTTPSPTHHS
eukprot:gene4294-4714_t